MRVRSGARVTLATLVVFVLGLCVWAPPRHSQAQTGEQVCATLPQGYKSPPFEPEIVGQGVAAQCMALYGTGSSGLYVQAYRNFADAETMMENFKRNRAMNETIGWGDRTLARDEADGGGSITFRKGCFIVEASWNAASKQRILSLLPAMVGALPSACPGAPEGPPPPAASQDGQNLGLACDQAALQSQGRLICRAEVANAPPGAVVTYQWSLDGVDQSATGQDLTLENISDGQHRVSVTARLDDGQIIGPQSVTFTRGAGAAPGAPVLGAGPGIGPAMRPNGDLGLPPILIGGVGIAVTLAVAGLILSRRNRGKAPAKPKPFGPQPQRPPPPEPVRPKPTAAPETLARPRPAPPPLEWPEQLSDKDDRKRSRPRVTVNLILRPSVLTQRLQGATSPKLLGDGADFMVAGYELSVSPRDEWKIVSAEPRWMVNGASWQFVDAYVPMRNVVDRRSGEDRHPAQRTDDWNVAIFTKEFRPNDSTLTIALEMDVYVAPVVGPGAPERVSPSPRADAPGPIRIVGANASFSLAGQSLRREAQGFAPQPEGTTAEADGSCHVRIEPVLDLFEMPYAGGLAVRLDQNEIAPASGALAPIAFGDFFEPVDDAPHMTGDGRRFTDDDALAVGQQGALLRCRFRLADKMLSRLPAQGVPITLTAAPTGKALGGGGYQADKWDFVLEKHYENCRDYYRGPGTLKSQPFHVKLSPSVIVTEGADPDELPRMAEESVRFTSYLAAQVRSAEGAPVKGSDIRKDLTNFGYAVTDWCFRFWYEPPDEEWRANIDPGRPREKALELRADDVDEEGWVTFGGARRLTYEHTKHFTIKYPRPSGDPSHLLGTYIGAQTRYVQIEFQAVDEPMERQLQRAQRSLQEWEEGKVPRDALDLVITPCDPIYVEALDRERFKLTVRVLAQSKEKLRGAKVVVKPVVQAEEGVVTLEEHIADRQGEVIIEVSTTSDNLYDVHVEWQTLTGLGRSVDANEQWVDPTNLPEHALQTGRTVEWDGKVQVDGDITLTVVLPVSSKWSLETDISGGKNLESATRSRKLKKAPGVQVSIGVGGGVCTCILINRCGKNPEGSGFLGTLTVWPSDPDRRRFWFGGAGLSAGLSLAACDVSGEASFPGGAEFETRFPVHFDDFHLSPGVMAGAEISLGLGEGKSYCTIGGLTTRPLWIDVSSKVVGLPAIGAQGLMGVWWMFAGDDAPTNAVIE